MIAATTDGGTGTDTGPEIGLARARRLVVKIGSATLVDEGSGQLRRAWLDALADDLAACRSRGQEVVVVTSGAVAVGREYLGLGAAGQGRPLRLEEKQAAAAAGQSRLIHAYQDALGRHGLAVAQILLTLGDTEARRRHLNARATIDTLLRLGAVPVINENDSVATAEIRFGDNDRLAARVAQMISADTLVLLSDIDGLHTADPRRDSTARLIPVVRELTAEIEAMAGNPLPGFGSGGMVTKIAAARIALAAGCRMVIARGERMNPLAALDIPAAEGGTPTAKCGTSTAEGDAPTAEGGAPSAPGGTPSARCGVPCTWFLPSAEPLTARKRWIAGHLNIVGTLTVDAGALQALLQGRSLLPAGVIALAGAFERGDAVAVLGPDGREIARGLCAYGSADAQRIIGRRSAAIAELLGYRGRDEMIHRDDLVLT